MKTAFPWIALPALILAALACGLPEGTVPTIDPHVLETMIASGLQTLQPSLLSTEQPASLAPGPTVTVSPESSEPACQPQPPSPYLSALPAGLMASIPDSEAVRLVNFEGQVVVTKNAPGLVFYEPGFLHAAGGISDGIDPLRIVYHTLDNMGTLKVNVLNAVSTLVQAPEMITLAGAPGQAMLAYSLNQSGSSGWISHLYAANLDAFPAVSPVLTRDEGDGYVLFPLVVRAVDDQAQGVWFTISMYGIGDIIFQPFRGLYYLTLPGGQVTEFLSFDHWLAGISPDQTLIAYRSGDLQAAQGLILRNLVTCQETPLPLHAESNLGAGFATFSPDNHHVAWLEANGVMLENAQVRMRVAAADGTMVADAPAANLYGLAGGEELTWLRPVGWVDNQQVLIELMLQDWDQRLLTRAEADFHNPILMADGNFMGSYYP